MSEENKDGAESGGVGQALREAIQPFGDLVRAPRALWGINLGYVFEGMCYFGILGYLAMYFNDFAGLNDIWAGRMVGVLTAGITISMFFLGGVADKKGVRFALLTAFVLLLIGRVIISAAPIVDPSHIKDAADTAAVALAGAGDAGVVIAPSPGMGSTVHILIMLGILLVVIGYGLYQPAAYAAVRQFTTPKTAAMGFAMLYALMNLGGWLPSFFGFVRQAIGMNGAMWVYTGITGLGLVVTSLILTRATVEKATTDAEAERQALKTEEEKEKEKEKKREKEEAELAAGGDGEQRGGVINWFKHHPLANAKFSFFIFCLIPVQTLFAHNWLTLPMYVERAFRGTVIGDYFEFAVNLNPLLIFIFVPIVTAVTQKSNVYKMMILGTFVMAAPTFLLALGATPLTLMSYLLIMTIGEAMWQPRFLQYAAEIAPEGRTGAYMGVAQFPWFLTKVIVPLYSGYFLERYCPDQGELNTEVMWLIYGSIAITSTIMLVLARGWLGKDFKTKADS